MSKATTKQSPLPMDGRTKFFVVLHTLILIVLVTPPVWDIMLEAELRWLFVFLFSWSLAAVLTPIAIQLSFATRCIDQPSGRKDHQIATPLLGGLAIIGAFGISLLISFHYSAPMKGVGLGGLLIWLTGIIDDRYEISARLKLVAQLAAVAILLAFGVQFTFLPNTPVGVAGEFVLTAIWVVGITNAVNFLDGMDGLAPGMSAIIAGFLALVALQTQQFYFSIVSLALFGACIGFLPFNFRWNKPARIFLGDNGATFLGFILASAAIMGDWAEDDTAALIVPVVLMGVPIFDMTMTTVTRFGTGKVRTLGQWLSYTGRDHLHHRLASLGIGRSTAVLVIWGLTLFLGITAVMLTHAEGIFALLMLVQAAMLLTLVTFFMIYVRKHQIRLFIDQSNNGAVDEEKLEEALNRTDRPGS
jgi:UDP-GlcNAc:undecaprenyl-phosphate GlcNAc-1-phosphate transferase